MSQQTQADEYLTRALRVLIAVTALLSLFFAFAGPKSEIVFAFFLVTCAFAGATVVQANKQHVRVLAAARVVLIVCMLLLPLGLYTSTGFAVKGSLKAANLNLCDEWLLDADNKVLGWLFPHGQLALWAQDSSWLSPQSLFGRFITEILQISYLSYYFWPNVICVWLLVKVVSLDLQQNQHLDLDEGRHEGRDEGQDLWIALLRFVSGLITAHSLCFFLNFVIPAVSPRLFLYNEFTTEPQGLLLAPFLRSIVSSGAGADPTNPTSFGSFPSGHCGVMWYTALVCSRLGFSTYAKWARVFAVLMVCAVLFLRYHYFVDAVCSAILVVAGLAAANTFPAEFDNQRQFSSVVYAPLS